MSKIYNVFSDDLNQINIFDYKIINTINSHSYCVAHSNILFKKALKSSDILLPDGMGIVFSEKIINRKNIKRISGYDLFIHTLSYLNKIEGKCFFLGSTNENLKKIKEKLSVEYPHVNVDFYSPPFCNEFDLKQNQLICSRINDFSPDILFIGLTAPKQEIWAFKNKNFVNAKTICSVGAVFDFYSGKVKRAPIFMQKIGMEWFYRSLFSFRLFKRNFISHPKFIFYILKELISIKK